MNFDCIIVGGGIIGMTTARELAAQGAKVALFDRKELGKEASWAAGGILSSMRPWSEHELSAELSEKAKNIYPGFVQDLTNETGIDSEYMRSGLLMIGEEDIVKTEIWANKNQIPFSLDKKYIPDGMKVSTNPIYLPDIAQVSPPKLLKALKESLKLRQIAVFENTEISTIEVKNGKFKSVKFNNEEISADSVIITSGAWSSQLLKGINNEINIKPIRGQMLCLKFSEQKFQPIILDGAHYFIPRLDGHVLIGSTMEDSGFINETTEAAKNELMNWACSVWPDITQAKIVKHWSGLRPASDSSYPYMGLLENTENVFINSGHFRKGILHAPVSARLLAEMVSNT